MSLTARAPTFEHEVSRLDHINQKRLSGSFFDAHFVPFYSCKMHAPSSVLSARPFSRRNVLKPDKPFSSAVSRSGSSPTLSSVRLREHFQGPQLLLRTVSSSGDSLLLNLTFALSLDGCRWQNAEAFFPIFEILPVEKILLAPQIADDPSVPLRGGFVEHGSICLSLRLP